MWLLVIAFFGVVITAIIALVIVASPLGLSPPIQTTPPASTE
jgi:hypothetical protein